MEYIPSRDNNGFTPYEDVYQKYQDSIPLEKVKNMTHLRSRNIERFIQFAQQYQCPCQCSLNDCRKRSMDSDYVNIHKVYYDVLSMKCKYSTTCLYSMPYESFIDIQYHSDCQERLFQCRFCPSKIKARDKIAHRMQCNELLNKARLTKVEEYDDPFHAQDNLRKLYFGDTSFRRPQTSNQIQQFKQETEDMSLGQQLNYAKQIAKRDQINNQLNNQRTSAIQNQYQRQRQAIEEATRERSSLEDDEVSMFVQQDEQVDAKYNAPTPQVFPTFSKIQDNLNVNSGQTTPRISPPNRRQVNILEQEARNQLHQTRTQNPEMIQQQSYQQEVRRQNLGNTILTQINQSRQQNQQQISIRVDQSRLNSSSLGQFNAQINTNNQYRDDEEMSYQSEVMIDTTTNNNRQVGIRATFSERFPDDVCQTCKNDIGRQKFECHTCTEQRIFNEYEKQLNQKEEEFHEQLSNKDAEIQQLKQRFKMLEQKNAQLKQNVEDLQSDKQIQSQQLQKAYSDQQKQNEQIAFLKDIIQQLQQQEREQVQGICFKCQKQLLSADQRQDKVTFCVQCLKNLSQNKVNYNFILQDSEDGGKEHYFKSKFEED
ncbi:UNKNOWN [Stylonychia lemnae]|uniref:Uncharacterized protein n=1 Tax=Stylonychia lemnae TaxID=5949 RepID=A0A077ZRN0_STYLE|nr:UNKNOWN [Stylonychia lemnae]|eukprot:CDW72578.1 UNKNOWN [Stylonychia lemnae]